MLRVGEVWDPNMTIHEAWDLISVLARNPAKGIMGMDDFYSIVEGKKKLKAPSRKPKHDPETWNMVRMLAMSGQAKASPEARRRLGLKA